MRSINELVSKGLWFLRDKDFREAVLAKHGWYNEMPDEEYLKMRWRTRMGYELNLDHPRTFNEKLQWLKLHDRRPEYTMMVDKYRVREFISEKLGDEFLIPLYGVWDNPEEIDFDALPEQFVLKCNHDSGGMCICKDKSNFDIQAAKIKLSKCLARDFFMSSREWPYKNVQRKIIAEKYMTDESGTDLKDYKFFCFDGLPKAMFIASDRQTEGEETKFDFYDMDFRHLPFTNGHPNAAHAIERPEAFEAMRAAAAKLSQGIPQVRVDLYDINGKIYFGEMTFFHWGGMMPFDPPEWDEKFGEWIVLPIDTKKLGGGDKGRTAGR